MALDQETLDWVDEMKSKGCTDEDLKPFLTKAEANEVLGKALKGSISATKHFKAKMDLVAKQETDAKKLAQANAALQQELVKWKTDEVDPALSKANQIVAEQAALKARITERARQLKDKYGIEDADVADLLETTTAVQSSSPSAAAAVGATTTDDGRFVKSEDFNRVALAQPRVSATFVKLERQFNRLFAGTDKEFDPLAVLDLAEEETRKGNQTSLEQAFSKLYDVPARQSQLTEAATQKRIEEEVAKRTAALEAKYAASPAYVRPDAEPSLISKVLERNAKDKAEPKSAEAASVIDQVRKAAQRVAPDDDISRYASISRSGKVRELVEKYAKETVGS